MESHILNTYHQARYPPIGRKVLRMKSDSVSFESSCNQNSPEYPQISVPQPRHFVDSSSGDWGQNQTMNQTQSSQDTSSDDESLCQEENGEQENVEDSDEELEESIVVHEVNVDVDDDDDNDAMHSNSHHNSIEDTSLVEGHDYDVITVYTVNPDQDLASSDEEIDTADYVNSERDTEVECTNGNDTSYKVVNHQESNTSQEGLDINLDTPVVSNVDEYFIKNNNEHILDRDGPVVKDVDEYFIKDKNKVKTPVPTIDDFFVKHKLPEEESILFNVPVPIPNVDDFLVTDVKKHIEENPETGNEADNEDNPENADVSINESDLEVLPNLEEFKRYFLEDMAFTKFRHIQKSSSVPQSPMQNICMDIDDVKTCMSFEDLNLDLSDLAFDNEKDKSENAIKSDDMPRTLTDEDINSFLITSNKTDKALLEDDLSHQDMEIERPVEATIKTVSPVVVLPPVARTSTPIPTVLDFCIEKSSTKKEHTAYSKVELEDFVDVESCHDTIIPVLEANNLNSLLEQFEATEKLIPKKTEVPVTIVQTEDPKIKSFNKNTLTNGMRLQDAGVQLNKNKMRQILMPTPINTTVKGSQSPPHSDHDYCSPKKRHSLPNFKNERSLLKPEVLSSNNMILNSRHRSCKSKKVVYHLSSDEETDSKPKNKKVSKSDDIDAKKKTSVKPSVKPRVQSNCRKKLSPPHSAPASFNDKSNSSVMTKSASKASDNFSQNSNSSIKLIIKNKSEVILNCDLVDSQKDKNLGKCKYSDSVKTNNVAKQDKNIKELDRSKSKVVNVNNVETVTTVKEEPRPKNENFYTALFSNKHDVQVPQVLQPKTEKRPFDDKLNMLEVAIKKEAEQPQKKKKLNLQEYKMRKGVCSNNSSATVSPEAIFPDMPSPLLDKVVKGPSIQTPKNGILKTTSQMNKEQTFFDPIKEASRKILMITKKQKAEAMRKRDEDFVLSKIPKVEKLQLQPLISDAEMLKIVGMSQPAALPVLKEKPQLSPAYEEIILVSIGTNTVENMVSHVVEEPVDKIIKSTSPTTESKSIINFKIKKSDHVLKQNVFDNVKRDKRSQTDEKKHSDVKIDKERYKDIAATLKTVGKQVETRILSNSLFSSIQDVVMKKAPEEPEKRDNRHSKSNSPHEKRDIRFAKTVIIREYDPKAEHGEDKVILHLERHRSKPRVSSIAVQTDPLLDLAYLPIPASNSKDRTSQISRKRNDSDMSLSSDGSPSRININKDRQLKQQDLRVSKPKEVRTERVESKQIRSRSKDRYDSKYRRRSRSSSRVRRKRSRSRSRSPSKSHGHYRRYKRSNSPCKRKLRSRPPFHKRISPTVRRDQSYSSKSHPRPNETRSRSPPAKKMKPSPHMTGNDKNERKIVMSVTPPLRKPTMSESSCSSSALPPLHRRHHRLDPVHHPPAPGSREDPAAHTNEMRPITRRGIEKLIPKKTEVPVTVVQTKDPKIKSFNKNTLTNGRGGQDAGV